MLALVGAALALAAVLVLVAFALRTLSRWVQGARFGSGGPPVDVVARIGLGPRQGLAVVRVGERGVLVSVGEGGVRPVLELTGDEVEAFVSAERPRPWAEAPSGRWRGVAGVLGAVRRSGAALLVIGAVGIGVLAAASPALAQAPGAAGPAAAVGPTSGSATATAATLDSIAAAVMPRLNVQLGDEEGGLRLSGTVGAVVVLGLLTLLPTLLLLMTSFTRILVVLHILRQALGTQNAPPGHLLAALALLLTGFVMAPTFGEINADALRPWLDGALTEGEMLVAAADPLREFMFSQTSESELETFLELGGADTLAGPEDVPLVTLMSAFAISELKKAFQIGFAIFLPFVVIDLVVAAVLTSMGMFMLPPAMVALPLKLMLFVLVDGWTLLVQSLFTSFH